MKNFLGILLGLLILACKGDKLEPTSLEYWQKEFTELSIEEARVNMKRDQYRMLKYPETMNVVEFRTYIIDDGVGKPGEVLINVEIWGTAQNYYGQERTFVKEYRFKYFIPQQYIDSIY